MDSNTYNISPALTQPTKSYVIFNVSEIDKIDFSLVCETSADTIRKSVDGTKTFIKWIGNQPAFVDNLTTKEGVYTLEEMRNILDTDVWKPQVTYA